MTNMFYILSGVVEIASTFPSGAQSHHPSGGYQINSNETCQQWHRQIKDGGAICCRFVELNLGSECCRSKVTCTNKMRTPLQKHQHTVVFFMQESTVHRSTSSNTKA